MISNITDNIQSVKQISKLTDSISIIFSLKKNGHPTGCPFFYGGEGGI